MHKTLNVISILLFIILTTTCTKDKKENTQFNKLLEYKTYGMSDTTLVFVHGWNINQTYWENQINEFSKVTNY